LRRRAHRAGVAGLPGGAEGGLRRLLPPGIRGRGRAGLPPLRLLGLGRRTGLSPRLALVRLALVRLAPLGLLLVRVLRLAPLGLLLRALRLAPLGLLLVRVLRPAPLGLLVRALRLAPLGLLVRVRLAPLLPIVPLRSVPLAHESPRRGGGRGCAPEQAIRPGAQFR